MIGRAGEVDPDAARRYFLRMRPLVALILAVVWIVASTVTANAGAAHGASHVTTLHSTVEAAHGSDGHAHGAGTMDHGGEAEDHAGCGSILSCSGFFASLQLPAEETMLRIAETPVVSAPGRVEGLRPGFQPPPPKLTET